MLDIVVPASIANLGPGLDTLALAVNLFVRLKVKKTGDKTGSQLRFHFANMVLEGDNLIEKAFLRLADGRKFPSMEVEVTTDIPLRSGLGSSSAALAAGFRLSERVFGKQPIDKLLDAGCAMEGHPENVAAALLGGLVICCEREDGSVIALRGAWPAAWRIVVATPKMQLATRRSRQVLPKSVPLRQAVCNVQHVALLMESVRTRNHQLLAEALRDSLHQPNRCAIVPGLAQLLALQHPDLMGVCLSGSGPSVAAVARRNLAGISKLLAATLADAGVDCVTRTVSVYPAR